MTSGSDSKGKRTKNRAREHGPIESKTRWIHLFDWITNESVAQDKPAAFQHLIETVSDRQLLVDWVRGMRDPRLPLPRGARRDS